MKIDLNNIDFTNIKLTYSELMTDWTVAEREELEQKIQEHLASIYADKNIMSLFQIVYDIEIINNPDFPTL